MNRKGNEQTLEEGRKLLRATAKRKNKVAHWAYIDTWCLYPDNLRRQRFGGRNNESDRVWPVSEVGFVS